MAEKLHAQYSPSTLAMLERCPGFRNRNEKNFSSERGDRIHDALEQGALKKLDEDERAIAQMCQDHIDALIQEKRPAIPKPDFRERTVNIDLGAGVKTFGTPDRGLIYGTHAEIFDYKSGRLEIKDAKENAQAFAYVIGVFQTFPELETVTFTFLVPQRGEVFEHTFSRDDISNMALRLNTIIRRAEEIDWSHIKDFIPKLNPGPELCEYCAHQTECPALALRHLSVAAKIGKGLPVPKSLSVSKDRPEDIAHIMRLIPLMEKWCETQRKEALRLNLQEAVEIPDFKRHSRKTDRAVNSVLGTWEAVKDRVALNKFLSICGSISLPSLEKFFAEAMPKGQKTKAGRDMECKLRDAGVWVPQGETYFLKEVKK
jgi:Protein of unknown function (DUF2800)